MYMPSFTPAIGLDCFAEERTSIAYIAATPDSFTLA